MAEGLSGRYGKVAAWLFAALAVATSASVAAEQGRNFVTSPRGASTSEQRLALVIGNSDYRDAPLKNPVNDATDMAANLKELGFKVILKLNASQQQMKDAIREFGDGLLNGGVGVFYYAGHGLQSRGRNYLVPVGAVLEREVYVESETVDAGMILSFMEEGRARVNIVILDACRNNPYLRNGGTRAVVQGGGLAEMQAAQGTLIAFATAPGSVALDGDGRNGVYTKNLLKQMRQPGVPIELMFKRVRDGVMDDTNDQQTPWESSSLRGADFYFKPSVVAAPEPVREPQQNTASAMMAAEIAFWESIKSSSNPDEYDAYIRKFPNGQFTPLAQVRLGELKKSVKPAPVQLASIAAIPAPEPTKAVSVQRPSEPAAEATKRVQAPHPAAAPQRSASAAIKDCQNCPELVSVPAGKFIMGSADDEPGRDLDEGPAHSVAIPRGLAFGKFEVTRSQFARFVQEAKYTAGPGCNTWSGKQWNNDPARDWRNPGFSQSDDDPVVCVSWNDAKAYTEWLSRSTGKRYRLPSEAEWEYAARAGTTSAYFWGANAQGGCKFANLVDASAKKAFSAWAQAGCSDGYSFTAPVGRFQANAFGLHDMAGNVWEWTEDCWNPGYADAPRDGTASSAGDCSRRVLRGGSWSTYERLARSAHRYGSLSVNRGAYNGFRVVRTD